MFLANLLTKCKIVDLLKSGHIKLVSHIFLKFVHEIRRAYDKFPDFFLYGHVNDLHHSLFHLLNCLITTASELSEYAKVTGSKVWTIGRVRNSLDDHLAQIVCDKDGVVDWCIVQVEMLIQKKSLETYCIHLIY